MSDVMTSDFFYSPEYRTQCVKLNAQSSAVPQGTIICIEASPSTSQADGTFDVIGTGTHTRVYGVLLKDVAASESAQSVDVIVAGHLSRSFVNAVYRTAKGSDLSAAQIAELRDIGIILK